MAVLLALGCTINAQKEPASPPPEPMQIMGKISVKGHMPFPYLCLTTTGNVEYRLVGPMEEKIWRNMQQRVLTVEGRIIKKAVGPGFPAEFEVVKIRTVHSP